MTIGVITDLGVSCNIIGSVVANHLPDIGTTFKLAYEGHQGKSKTEGLIRSKAWFPGINSADTEVDLPQVVFLYVE